MNGQTKLKKLTAPKNRTEGVYISAYSTSKIEMDDHVLLRLVPTGGDTAHPAASTNWGAVDITLG
jgi:hypothetical protein